MHPVSLCLFEVIWVDSLVTFNFMAELPYASLNREYFNNQKVLIFSTND